MAEAVDDQAGIKFSARHCFMLENITITVRQRVQTTGPDYEVSLKDEMWQELLAKGKICGEERWLVGENGNQQIVILHFDKEAKSVEDSSVA